ncbi:MAG: hypothetical protein GXY36_10065 [Chloroflexi bacterium]|nr:hypothetical protein [Chloroflexota bacterium]
MVFVTYLYYLWFAVQNRYLIFLYFHDLGPDFDTTPFGRMTVSRYWMTGLVASGAVMILYTTLNFVLGRALKHYEAPAARRVWMLCAVPLLIIVPAIVMTANDPTLPLRHTVQVVVMLLVGLGLALWLGEYAAKHPVSHLLLLIDGLALTCLLVPLRRLHAFSYYAERNPAILHLLLKMLLAGAILLAVTTAVCYARRRAKLPDAVTLFVAGLNVHYLVLPLCHYLFWCTDEGSWTDPGYFSYIPSVENYFPRNVWLQLGVWLAGFLIALGITRLRMRLRQRRPARP